MRSLVCRDRAAVPCQGRRLSVAHRLFARLAIILTGFAATFVGVGVAASADLNVAVLAPLSGQSAFLGQALVDGAKLAVDERNARGGIKGRQIRLQLVDDQNDP